MSNIQRTPPRQPTKSPQAPEHSVVALLNQQADQIKRALPAHMRPDRMLRIALTECRKNPQLLECDGMSLLGAIIQCAQLGLEPGSGLGHAYLIPFKNYKTGVSEVQFMPGYRGLIDLVRRSGKVKSIRARLVYEGDDFEYQYGDEEKIVHVPGRSAGPRQVTHAYAIAEFTDGGFQREVMTLEEVAEVRDRKKQRNPVWETDFGEMARKTVVRRLCKYLPLSPEMAQALEADNAIEMQESQGLWQVVNDKYQPAPPKHDPAKIAQAWTDGPQDGTLDAAKSELKDEIERVRKTGKDPADLVGMPVETLLSSNDPRRISGAFDILSKH